MTIMTFEHHLFFYRSRCPARLVSVEGSKERAPRRQKSKVERLIKAKENRRYSYNARNLLGVTVENTHVCQLCYLSVRDNNNSTRTKLRTSSYHTGIIVHLVTCRNSVVFSPNLQPSMSIL
jgi:hypothetical protein